MGEVFQVTSVDKFHGCNREVECVALDHGWADTRQSVGAALRNAGLLSRGQSVRTVVNRGAAGIVVFPNNAPGMTTGLHSLTLHPSLGAFPLPGRLLRFEESAIDPDAQCSEHGCATWRCAESHSVGGAQ